VHHDLSALAHIGRRLLGEGREDVDTEPGEGGGTRRRGWEGFIRALLHRARRAPARRASPRLGGAAAARGLDPMCPNSPHQLVLSLPMGTARLAVVTAPPVGRERSSSGAPTLPVSTTAGRGRGAGVGGRAGAGAWRRGRGAAQPAWARGAPLLQAPGSIARRDPAHPIQGRRRTRVAAVGVELGVVHAALGGVGVRTRWRPAHAGHGRRAAQPRRRRGGGHARRACGARMSGGAGARRV
jgi:hypothetical protein